MDPDLFQIWFGATEPVWSLRESGIDAYISFALVFSGLNANRWAFTAEGPIPYEGDPWHSYFDPPAPWWSLPDDTPPTFMRTWVQGYKWVEWGGGWSLVLADEDWSFSPKNYADGIPRPNWKYGHAYPNGPQYYWAWDSVYLDLR
ncbi:MAG: hypothetical protein NTW26_04015 [bacterium]|nr:hypothetical protein [bacterium]